MDIWIFRQKMTQEEEKNILSTEYIYTDWTDVPSLEKVHDQGQLRSLLRTQYPDSPPEEIAIRTELLWKFAGGLSVEDTVAVPLPATKHVAFAEITGPYTAKTDAEGRLAHARPVKWFPQTVPIFKFYRHKDIFDPGSVQLERVTNPQARNMIRDKLPLGFNRFAKIKWLIGFLFFIRIAQYVIEQLHGQ